MSQSQGPSDPASLLARQSATTALFGGHATYVEDLYERYLAGEEVPADWATYFQGVKPTSGAERAHGPIVRELTEAMGGSVAVENLSDRGARFTVRLPA